MWTISEVKERGKAAFKANYWKSVAVALIMGLFTGSSGGSASNSAGGTSSNIDINSVAGGMNSQEQLIAAGVITAAVLGTIALMLLLKVFLFNPLHIGGCAFFRANIEEPAELNMIGRGFQNYWRNFGAMLLRDLLVFLFMLLLIIPGIIKAYAYRMVPYILAENPDISAKEALALSQEMMDGNKMEAFKLDLSFIGWILLGILTLGLVLVFWTGPYMQNTNAALYARLSEKRT